MSKNKIEISVKDIPEIIEQLKDLEKELEFERKSKNLFIDDLYKVCEISLKQEKEIERLHSIIKEVREYIRSNEWGIDYEHSNCRTHLLEILDKVDKEK